MKECMLNEVLHECKRAEKIFIVGAGNTGRELEKILKRQKQKVEEFWDNNPEKEGTEVDTVKIYKPYRCCEENSLYIIAVNDAIIKEELYMQLLDLGINLKDIISYIDLPNPEYVKELDEIRYQDAIESLYLKSFGRVLNLENPLTYNEKINWEKLNIKDPVRTRLADKVEVRKWVKEQIGENHLTKWYGVWNDAKEIDFEKLPNAFVLKANNGSGRNILVKDKSKMDVHAVINQLNEWMEQNYAFTALELHYKDIPPRILCEEYLDELAETVYDYNIYCFHGEPKYIWCIKGSHRPGCQASFYSLDWEMQPFSYGYPKDEEKAPRPDKLEEMLALSRKLCKQFKHVRVDWYNMPDGRVLFGEMTFATWAGLSRFQPEDYDLEFGKLME